MNSNRSVTRPGLTCWLGRAVAVMAVVLPLAGCDDLLDVRDPDIADPRELDDANALPAYRAAAVGEAAIAYDGTDGQITYSGMMADELINSETFPTRIQIDIRTILVDNSNLDATTRDLYQARASAELAARKYEQFEATDEVGYAEVLNLAAFIYILFGENYCSGVPFSVQNEDGSLVYGGRETTTEVFERAVDAAESARAVAGATPTQVNLASVLLGRALLNLDRADEAAAAVAGVPTNFVYGFAHSENTTRENNGVFAFNRLNRRVSMADGEGGNGLLYRSSFAAGDPRTPWTRLSGTSGIGFDTSTPLYLQQRYFSRSAFTPVATGVEARLIEAEAALRNDDVAAFLENLNEPRGDAQSLLSLWFTDYEENVGGSDLDDVTDPGTDAERVDLLFRERAFWMYLTSHRLGDLRRLIRQYGRDQAAVFPTGDYHKDVQGGVYGSDVNFPLTVDERNNPELSGIPTGQELCLDRDA